MLFSQNDFLRVVDHVHILLSGGVHARIEIEALVHVLVLGPSFGDLEVLLLHYCLLRKVAATIIGVRPPPILSDLFQHQLMPISEILIHQSAS